MRLNIKMIKNVANVNQWEYANEAYIQEGQANEFYFQIVDLDKTPENKSRVGIFPEYPMRYISQATSFSVSVTFESIDDAQEFSVNATQPFVDDRSICKVSLSASQSPKAGSIKVSITEDGVVKTFIAKATISVDYLNIGSC